MNAAAGDTSASDQAKIFPWGSNRPTRPQRLLVALAVATLGAVILVVELGRHDVFHTDFGPLWFGARALLDGRNPYPLVGPGREFDWEWTLLYPGPALVAALPFAWLSEQVAAVSFVFVSTFLLAYGISRRSWHLLPIFASEAFANSARLAQWSILFTAALFLPALAFFAVAKPQAGIPVLAASSSAGLRAAGVGGLVLIIVSLALLPTWPLDWVGQLQQTDHMRPAIGRLGGILVLLLLLRWRRREAWLVMMMALIPQTWGWYNVLILFTVAATFREAAALALFSTAGALAAPYVIGAEDVDGFYATVGALQVATAYLPATLLVLRRPNKGEPPAWLAYLITSGSSLISRGTRKPRNTHSATAEKVRASTFLCPQQSTSATG